MVFAAVAYAAEPWPPRDWPPEQVFLHACIAYPLWTALRRGWQIDLTGWPAQARAGTKRPRLPVDSSLGGRASQPETAPWPRLEPPVQPGVIPSSSAPRDRTNRDLPHPLPPPVTQRVSLHLADVDVREALETFSRTHQLNILVAPDVSGKVTVNFEGVPLNAAIEGILKLCNLAARHEGELIFVYSASKLPDTETFLRVFPLDYTTAEQLLTVVKGLLSESGQAYSSQVMPSDNRRTHEAIVVTDREYNLNRVAEYIAQMDQPPRQVMIEAHVLEINLADGQRHGVNFRYLLGQDAKIALVGMANPTASPALFLEIDGNDVDSLVECLQTTTDAKTLASPRIMVVNGQKAQIQVGGQIGFKVITVTQTAAMEEVKFLDTGVVLEVTPHITRDRRVLMRVKPKVASGELNPDTLLPESETRQLETNVLVADGQGVVIGGLIQEKDRAVRDKVRWLGDLWLIGNLFQRASITKERNEIVITLVPRIVESGCPATERDAADLKRTQAPLFEGPLGRASRPWEPCLPDPNQVPSAISTPQGSPQEMGYRRCCRTALPGRPGRPGKADLLVAHFLRAA